MRIYRDLLNDCFSDYMKIAIIFVLIIVGACDRCLSGNINVAFMGYVKLLSKAFTVLT